MRSEVQVELRTAWWLRPLVAFIAWSCMTWVCLGLPLDRGAVYGNLSAIASRAVRLRLRGRRRWSRLAAVLVAALLLLPAAAAAGETAAPAMAGGALMACPWSGACEPGIGYPLASWRSLFGAKHGTGELLGLALKGTAGGALGLGVAHVFWASAGASAPRASVALGGGFVMPLSGAGGLRTAQPVAFLVLGVGGSK